MGKPDQPSSFTDGDQAAIALLGAAAVRRASLSGPLHRPRFIAAPAPRQSAAPSGRATAARFA